MIYTVTFNPALDYIMHVDNYCDGKVNRTKNELILPGGKGINVSIVLNNLGVENKALGFCAGFTGTMLKSMLSDLKINHDFIDIEDGFTRINVKIKSDEETEINGAGPIINAENIKGLTDKLSQLTSSDILVLSGSVPESAGSDIYCKIMKMLKNNKIIVDAEGELLKGTLKYKPFLIKPNQHELGALFGKTLETYEEVKQHALILQEMGAQNVLVSMGGKGALMVCEDGRILCAKAPYGKVINSTGAGDSMVAGFIAGFSDGSYEDAFFTGIAAGSASAFSPNLATKEEVLDIRKNIQNLII